MKNRLFEPFIDLLLLNIPFRLVGYFANWGGRITLYTNALYHILPEILVDFLYRKNNKRILKLYYIIYFLLYYFIYSVIIYNHHDAYPYNTIFG